jgi:2',3'-cyclic-nucleotide 2'-phosphodiesterase (5'-nucleotidase family)
MLIKKIRLDSINKKNILLFDLGDNISGTPESFYTKGMSAIELLNFQNLNSMLIGNREFDYGQAVLENLRGKSNFIFLSSNIKNREGASPDFITPYLIKSFEQFNIGIIGITPPDTPGVTDQKNIKNLNFFGTYESIKENIEILKSKKVDFIVCLSQLNISKTNMDDLKKICMNGLDILFVITLELQSAFKINNTWIVPLYRENKGAQVIIADCFIDKNLLKVKVVSKDVVSSLYPPEPEISKVIIDISRKIDNVMNEILACTDSDILTYKMKESSLGNLICDIIKDYTGADIAFQNSGGIQANFKKGEIRLRDIYKVLPFENEIVTMKLSGAEVKEILLNSATKFYGLMQLSGASYKFSSKVGESPKLIDVKVGGQPLDDNKLYFVATNSFLASGGDKYFSFKKGRDIKIHDSLRQVIIDGLKRIKKLTSKIEKRIIEIER